jgi:hypothetical protein
MEITRNVITRLVNLILFYPVFSGTAGLFSRRPVILLGRQERAAAQGRQK